MTKKDVSVRLSAEGGNETKSEFEEVGRSGDKSFRKVSDGVDRANRRLAAFARRAKLVAAATIAAATASGFAMVRSSLQTVDAQAKLAQSLGTTVQSVQILERAGGLAGVSMSGVEQATKDLTRRLSQAAAGTGPAADALDRLELSASKLMELPLDERIAVINDRIEKFVPAAERAAVAGQLFGEEGSIAMSRIDSATLVQATKDIRDFGVAISEQDADGIERANDALTRLRLAVVGIGNQLTASVAPALETVANGVASIARVGAPLNNAFKAVVSNLDRVAVTAGAFVAFMAGRWVVGVAAAVVTTIRLAGALTVLRGALLRTGIGVIVVLAGELIYRLGQTVSAIGGMGEAFKALATVGVEVWDRISQGLDALVWFASGAADGIKSAFAGAFASVLENFASMTNGIADGYNKLLGSLGIESNAEGIGNDLAASIRATADGLKANSENALGAGRFLIKDAFRALESLKALREAVKSTREETDMTGQEFEVLEDTLEAVTGAAGGSKAAVDDLDKGLKNTGLTLKSVRDSAAKTFADIFTGATKASEAVGNLLRSFSNTLLQSAFASGFNSLFPGIGANARGTNYWRGGLTAINEEGPEIVDLPRGTRVYPASLSRRMANENSAGGGVQVSMPISIDATGGETASVAQQISDAMREVEKRIARTVENAVIDGRRRGRAV